MSMTRSARWLLGGLLAFAIDPPSTAAGEQSRPHRRRRSKHSAKKRNDPPAVAKAPAGSHPSRFIIPVRGVKPEALVDTFSAARSNGRVHDAIDIPAPRGTPVVAAIDGKVIKLFLSERGGVTVNQLADDGETVCYYAHLDRYAPGLAEGAYLHQGDVIGYVGDTGNAGRGNYHLHFAIWRITDARRYWEGTNIDPYPLLTK